MSDKKALRLLLASLLAGTIALACGGEEPPKPEPQETPPKQAAKQAPTPAPAVAPRKASPLPSPAEQLRAEVEMPSDYPSDGLDYPGAHANSVSRQAGRLSVIFSTPDPEDEVLSSAKSQLEDKGWQNVVNVPLPTGSVLQGEKGGRRIAVVVSAVEEDGENAGTMIAVGVHPTP